MAKYVFISIAFFILFLTVSIPIHSQDVNIKPTQKTQETNYDISISNIENRLEYADRYNDKILNTVYWSLGIIVTIAVMLVGFGWLANFKIYERDINSIKKEANSEILSQIKKLELTLLGQNKEDIDSKITETHKKLKEVLSSAKSEMLSTKHIALENQAAIYKLTKNPANAILSFAEIIDNALLQGYDWRISDALDNIKDLFAKGVTMTAGGAKQLSDSLNNLPKEYEADIQAVKILLNKSQSSTT